MRFCYLIAIFFLVFGCVLIFASAAGQSNSSSYSSYVDIGVGDLLSSSNYSAQTSIGDIIGSASSSNYITGFGFIPTIIAVRSLLVSLNYPADGASLSSGIVNFNWTAIGTNPICNLTIDGVVNASGIASPNGTAVNYSVSGISDGTYIWNVSCSGDFGSFNASVSRSFSVSTAAPSEPSIGAGAGIVVKEDFNVNPQLLEYQIKKGTTIVKQIAIKNLANKEYDVSIEQENLNKFVLIKEAVITLKPFEEKIVDIIFYAPESEKADVYFGEIIITSSYKQEIVHIIAELKEKAPLFDIRVSIPETSKNVLPCAWVYANITLENMGDVFRVDVLFDYAIKDFSGEVINEKSESIAVEQNAELNRFLRVPCGTPGGGYIFYGRVSYANQTASAYDRFEIIQLSVLWMIIVALIIVFLIVAIVILVKMMKKKNHRRGNRRYHEKSHSAKSFKKRVSLKRKH